MNIPAINYHLLRACNAKCRFCFATFRDVSGQHSLDETCRLLEALWEAGGEKLNFAGGEPTLHPHLGVLLAHARQLGFTTSIVTNGFRLRRLLEEHSADLDWVGISVDSGDEAIQAALGRGTGGHVAHAIQLAELCRVRGVRVKLNTVVTALTWQENMSALVRAVCPERWKVFQVLPMKGQNTGKVEDLLISAAQFQVFLAQHAHLASEGFAPIAENNDAMRGSYVMVDPLGRFFGNATGQHVYSAPILEVGVAAALTQVGYEPAKFEARGGRYAW